MTEEENTAAQAAEGQQSASASDNKQAQARAELEAKLKELVQTVGDLPIPSESRSSWLVSPPMHGEAKGFLKNLLGKRKGLSPDEMNELRKTAQRSPGAARAHVQEYLQSDPGNPDLHMVSATCAYQMMSNTSNNEKRVLGLKNALLTAATSLMTGKISLFNVEQFLIIYFSYLDRLKREQANALKRVKQEVAADSLVAIFPVLYREMEVLFGAKKRSEVMINHLKKLAKSSNYATIVSLADISNACRMIEGGKEKEAAVIGTAKDSVMVIYYLCNIFTKIPMLDSLTDMIAKAIPETDKSLTMRKGSISSNILITKMKRDLAVGNIDGMKKHVAQLMSKSEKLIKYLGSQQVQQPYEADPFFNLATAVQSSLGVFDPEEEQANVKKAIAAMEHVIRNDMSKNHRFTEAANKMMFSLMKMQGEAAEEQKAANQQQKPKPEA